MLFELGRALSFFLGMLSLYPVLVSGFFEPGSHWQERLVAALLRAALAGCICLASGLLFSCPSHGNAGAGQPLMSTLPMQLYLWAMAGMALLFVVSWYFETYYLPLLHHNCCRP